MNAIFLYPHGEDDAPKWLDIGAPKAIVIVQFVTQSRPKDAIH